MRNILPLAAVALFSVQAWSFSLPKSLSRSDRKEVVRMLGFGSSAKLLSNPFPLGGYPGLEVGLAIEIIDTSDLARLGDRSETANELTYPKLSLGKGLYNDLDIFFGFVPYSDATRMSEYEGIFKWNFYQAKFLPVSLSAVFHGNNININDSFISQTVGIEIMAGINVDNFAIYFGGGQLQSDAKFLASSSTSTNNDGIVDPDDSDVDDTNFARMRLREGHTFVGASFQFSDLFVAVQIDRYKNPTYSAKIGLRL